MTTTDTIAFCKSWLRSRGILRPLPLGCAAIASASVPLAASERCEDGFVPFRRIPQLKIHNPIPSGISARQCKQNDHKKNSLIFSGHFAGKSLGNHAKTVKKTLQNHAKNPRFSTQKTSHFLPLPTSWRCLFARTVALANRLPLARVRNYTDPLILL